MHLPTRSAHDPLYRELETYIEKKLLTRAPQQSNRESILSQRMTDLESVMRSAEGGGVPPDAHGRALLASVYAAQEPLPTIYDDPMNHWLAAFLLKTVRKAADELGFPSAGYGGFCCAPTGSVNAQAVPIRVDSAIERHGSATPHLPAAPRLELLMDAMQLTREQRGMCRAVSELFSVVFEDTLTIARE